jgi:hypothetical protein
MPEYEWVTAKLEPISLAHSKIQVVDLLQVSLHIILSMLGGLKFFYKISNIYNEHGL